MEDASPARLYCLLVGAVLVIAGIIGFFYEASFATGDSIRTHDVFGVLSVNGWHNLVHILAGVLGLLAYGAGAYAARTYAMTMGVLFLTLAVWGFVVGDGDSVLSIIPVNTEDNILHLLLGVAGLGAALATPAEARASAPPAAA